MKFKYLLLVVTLVGLLQGCFAPPVSPNKKEEAPDSEVTGLEDYMEYHRYLKEVVNALESDPEFRQKLEKADESEIKSGKIADELQFVSHFVRTKLDEIKRLELQRLKELTEKKRQLENGIDDAEDPVHHHLDQSNPHTFEIEDLKKLIAKTTHDLEVADKARKEEFKRYEMEKEYQKMEKLNHTDGQAEREALEKQFKEQEEKHKKHEKLHEPGHKAQLEEVWEEQDQMQQDFDPKTFFLLHDLDGNGLWDQDEVKTLFIRELDKVYQQGVPEDDMRERIEEMERMRERMFAEMDTNRDGFIDFQEFFQQTNSNDFKQDHGWQTLDEQTKPYSPEELEEYIRRAHADNNQVPQQRQFQAGQVPQMAPQQLDLNVNEVQPQYRHVPVTN
ncbi:nucleobindin-1 [Anthonomus grandis grandis]|uniref:nucleobindin-1 n=1 Tax=Anthonomus grandis grandis TaxID=2921223 RepID=UPI0021651EC2|nr:nucleobindin-1 [Anthonomus grandis grandis]